MKVYNEVMEKEAKARALELLKIAEKQRKPANVVAAQEKSLQAKVGRFIVMFAGLSS